MNSHWRLALKRATAVVLVALLAAAVGCYNRPQDPLASKAGKTKAKVIRQSVAPGWTLAVELSFRMATEGDSRVLYARGRTIWVTAWTKQGDNMKAETLAFIKQQASSARQDVFEYDDGAIARYAYLLQETDAEAQYGLHAYAITDGGYLQLAIYYNDDAHGEWADRVARSAMYDADQQDSVEK